MVRALLNALELPSKAKPEEDLKDGLIQVARHISQALHGLLLLAEKEACLKDFVEQGLLPVASAQFHETSKSTDMRLLVVLEALCGACGLGEAVRSIEAKVTKPLWGTQQHQELSLFFLEATYRGSLSECHDSAPRSVLLLAV